MAEEITDRDILNVFNAIRTVHANALIEDALEPRTSPFDGEIEAAMQVAENSGDPVRARTANLMLDVYRLRCLSPKAGE